MRTSIAFSILLLTIPASASGDESPTATYNDPIYGFSVEVPALGDRGGVPVVTRVTFSASARGDFAPNCNVQVQYLEMELSGYVEMSLGQFEAAGLEVIEHQDTEVSGRSGVVFEYAGTMGGRDLRFLALVVPHEDAFLLTTCVAPPDVFADYEEDFRAVIGSFELSPSPRSGP